MVTFAEHEQKVNKNFNLIAVILIAIAIIICYAQVFGAGFMSWDDPEYVLHNPDIQAISFENISKWFTKYYVGNYQPLTMFSCAVDYALFGIDPIAYHFTSIIIHILNSILVYLLINKIFQHQYIALIIALFFALHPTQTESVSWIAERKNVLFGLFFLSSHFVYAQYVFSKKLPSLLLVYLLAVCAMLCKATAVTIPFSLLAIDILLKQDLFKRSTWLSKLPLILVSLVIGVIAIGAQKEGDFLGLHPELQWYHTLIYAGYAYVQYIILLLFPFQLSVLYPYPASVGFIHVFYCILAIALVVVMVYAFKKKWHIIAGGLLFYTVNIAIVLQFVQFGEVLMADRYLYIAALGIWIIVVYSLYVWIREKSSKAIAVALCTIWLCFISALTYGRNQIWLSELNFWESVIEKFPESSVALASVGGVYLNEGNYSSAMQYTDQALAIDQNNSKAWYNKGVIFLRQGDVQNALNALDKSLSIKENNNKALFTRALIYQQIRQPQLALMDIQKVLQDEKNNARAYYIRGNCREQQNDFYGAIVDYTKAIELGNGDMLFYLRRGICYAQSKQYQQALSDVNTVIGKNSENGEAWYWRGVIKNAAGIDPCSDLVQADHLGYDAAQAAIAELCSASR